MNMHYKDEKFFKKLSVLQKIREDYTQYLVEQFPKAQLLARYQNPRHAKLNLGQSAAKIIEAAYPVVKIDKAGREIDNRDQQCIDTITHFVEVMSDKEKQGKKLSWQEKELICATKVYGALSAVEMQKVRLKKKIHEIKQELEGEEAKEAINMALNTFKDYCMQLTDALKDHQKILERGKRAASVFGKMINALEDLTSYIRTKFKGKPRPLLWKNINNQDSTVKLAPPKEPTALQFVEGKPKGKYTNK